ncbi:unnamed protein product, partial [Didymodactylos carnosus]
MNRNNNSHQYTPPSTIRRNSTLNPNVNLSYYNQRSRQQLNNPFTYTPQLTMVDSRTQHFLSQPPPIHQSTIHQQFPNYNASSLFDLENPELNHDFFTSPTFTTLSHRQPQQQQRRTMHRQSYVPPVYSTATTNIFSGQQRLDDDNNRFKVLEDQPSSHYTPLSSRESSNDSFASRMDIANDIRARLLNDIQRSITDLDDEIQSLDGNRSRYLTTNTRYITPQSRFSPIIELDIQDDKPNPSILDKFIHSTLFSQNDNNNNNNNNRARLLSSQPTSAIEHLSLNDNSLWPQKQKRAYEVIPRLTKTSRQSSSTTNNFLAIVESEPTENQPIPIESSSSDNNREEQTIDHVKSAQRIEDDLPVINKDSYETNQPPTEDNLISNEKRSSTQVYHYGPEIDEIEILSNHPENVDIYETHIDSIKDNDGDDLKPLTIDQFLRDRSTSPRSRVMLTANIYSGGSEILDNETQDILHDAYDVARSLLNSPQTDLAETKDLHLENLKELVQMAKEIEPKEKNRDILTLAPGPTNTEILLSTPIEKHSNDTSNLSVSSAKTLDFQNHTILSKAIKHSRSAALPVNDAEKNDKTNIATTDTTISNKQPYFFSDFGNDDEEMVSLDTNNFVNNLDTTGAADGGSGGQSDYVSNNNNAFIIPQGEEEKNNFSTTQQQFKRNNTVLNEQKEKKGIDENMSSPVTTTFENNHHTNNDNGNILITNSNQDRAIISQSAISHNKLAETTMDEETLPNIQHLQQSVDNKDSQSTHFPSRPVSSKSHKEPADEEKQGARRHSSSKSRRPHSRSSAIVSPNVDEKSVLDLRQSVMNREERKSARTNSIDSLKNENVQESRPNPHAASRNSLVTSPHAAEIVATTLDGRHRSRKNSSNVVNTYNEPQRISSRSPSSQSKKRLSSQNYGRVNSPPTDGALMADDLNTSSVSHMTPQPPSKHISARSTRSQAQDQADDDSQLSRQNSNIHEINKHSESPIEGPYSSADLLSDDELNDDKTIADLLKNIPQSYEKDPPVKRNTHSSTSNSSLPVQLTNEEKLSGPLNSVDNSLAPSRNQSPTVISRKKYSITSNPTADNVDFVTAPVNNAILLQTTTDDTTTTTTITVFGQQNEQNTIEQTITIAPTHVQDEPKSLEIEFRHNTSPVLLPTPQETRKNSSEAVQSVIRQNDEENIRNSNRHSTPSIRETPIPSPTPSSNSLRDNLDVPPQSPVERIESKSQLDKPPAPKSPHKEEKTAPSTPPFSPTVNEQSVVAASPPLEIEQLPQSEKSVSTSNNQDEQVTNIIRDGTPLNS